MWRFSYIALVGIVALIATLGTPGLVAAQAAAQPTPTEVTYFADTAPFRAHLAENQQWLEGIQQAMATGHADEVSTDEIANLTRELFAARQGFERAIPSARLDQYHRTVALALDRAYTAAVLLLHAQVTDSGTEHDARVHDAEQYTASSGKLLREAADLLAATSLAAQ
jgi:hypothetical protein